MLLFHHWVFNNYIVISYIPACFAGDAVNGGLEGAIYDQKKFNDKRGKT